ncbi:MAG: MBL fold metallo-hydrolase [Lunatimonas sp.]|uniref:MBL fold metallo-hydrolase n=1 Tax=Lunatimonas sp. TaxID=2060141 RepID=UPI00263BE60B|nr:MBL fold metallo-hydrolase [Lunatimonas sp.]MCC5937215.1 MBL fold metallo-hydrolase [Lunatimonas sp.]
MRDVEVLDLNFRNASQAIGAFLVKSSAGLILVETGPESTFSVLNSQVEALGYQLSDIRYVLLSHIHFDHAGAAWKLAQAGAQVYVHPVGLPHLASPDRLWNSASQIYGAENMGKLWGRMEPIPESAMTEASHGESFVFGDVSFTAWHTPGHASHHIAWEFEGGLFTGDVAGVKICGGPAVPPCPPPDIHMEAWKDSLQLIRKIAPSRLYLTHFGMIEMIEQHLDELEEAMDSWAMWIKAEFDNGTTVEDATPRFMEFTRAQMNSLGVSEAVQSLYEYANPSWMSVAGLMRYWKLKAQGRL